MLGWLYQSKNEYAPLIKELEQWVLSGPARRRDFADAVATAQSHNTLEMQDIDSFDAFLGLVNEQLHWIPSKSVRPKELLFRLTKIWFFLDQPSVIQYQSPIRPIIGMDTKEEPTDQLTSLSRWMVRFSNEVGKFMDTPASAAHLEAFRSSPSYRRLYAGMYA
jgi:hypothetical protein